MSTTTPSRPSTGLKFPRKLTKPGETLDDVFAAVDWETVDIIVGDYEDLGAEFPAFWTDQTRQIVSQKYMRGATTSPDREKSIKTVIKRIAGTIADWGLQQGHLADQDARDGFEAELGYLLLHQFGCFNSPVLFNLGWHEVGDPRCQSSACFILGVQDDMESILGWNTIEGRIFRGGSGAGINLSKIRGSMEPLSKGGIASGPVSFMRGADAWAGTIKSGGGTRRAAKMVVLDVDHPDIVEFVECKEKEEEKAIALKKAGFDVSLNGEASRNLLYQNANNSVSLSDAFMEAVENDAMWQLTARVDGRVLEEIPARELWAKITRAAWRCADPGLHFSSTINRMHTTAADGPITGSNPCSEFLSNDWTACNLASLNLLKFRRANGGFDIGLYRHAIELFFSAQEIIVGMTSYPEERIAANAVAMRQLGLGYCNLGALLMSLGLPYDSDAARLYAGAITSILGGRAYRQSAQTAKVLGPYERYEANAESHTRVIGLHHDHAGELVANVEAFLAEQAALEEPYKAVPKVVQDALSKMAAAGLQDWAAAQKDGLKHGFRNAQATLLAPTGTISFWMGADTTGIEPGFSLVTFKTVVGSDEVMQIVNGSVSLALQTLGYDREQIDGFLEHFTTHGDLVDAAGLDPAHLPVFDVAVGERRSIAWTGHLGMMAAAQPFLSGAISKTCNLPETATEQDIGDAYMLAWKSGLKCVAIYRDGSKSFQVLNVKKDEQDAKLVPVSVTAADGNVAVYSEQELKAHVEAILAEAVVSDEAVKDHVERLVAEALSDTSPRRRRMPTEAQSIRHKFSIGGQEGYIHAGLHEDGQLGEVFLTGWGKEGSTLSGLLGSFATLLSIALQYGVPLETIVEKFSYTRFEPEGMTGNPEIPFAKSICDYLVRWLASRFMETEDHMVLGILTPAVRAAKAAEFARSESPAPIPSYMDEEDLQLANGPVAVATSNGHHPGGAVMTQSRLTTLLNPAGNTCDNCGSLDLKPNGMGCHVCNSCGSTTACG